MVRQKAANVKRSGRSVKRKGAGASLEGQVVKPRGVTRLEFVAAGELKGHPRNWRRHPASQVRAFQATLREVGWVGFVLVNERTGLVLDGHMRMGAVPAETLVPVLFGEWSEEEEKLILATHDPIAGMAGVDARAAEKLLAAVQAQEPGVQALLELLEAEVQKVIGWSPPPPRPRMRPRPRSRMVRSGPVAGRRR